MLFFYIALAVIVFCAIMLFLIFPAIRKHSDLKILNGLFIAHRGLHQNTNGIPENSLKAFKKAIEKGYAIENDIHINIPNIAIKKEGPSAGVAITTSLISALSNLKVGSNIAMTGEITLWGNILKVGGIKNIINHFSDTILTSNNNNKTFCSCYCGVKKIVIKQSFRSI